MTDTRRGNLPGPAHATRSGPTRRSGPRWAFPVGRIAGIPISVHVTFLLLLVLIAVVESRPGGLGALNAVLWVLTIFACVLVHELAHSLVARRKGAAVKSILLLPIGGVSQIEKMPTFWADELAVAAVGPLASLVLGIMAGWGAVMAGKDLLPVRIYDGAFLPRLAWVNLLLCAFNLLPAFPLDGGRVLRAALERRRDPETATRIAARTGRALAGAMIVAGLFWNLWLTVIGAFVWMGASQEEQATTLHTRLSGHPVHQFMRSPVATLDARRRLDTLPGLWAGPQVVTLDGLYYGLVNGSDIEGGDPQLTLADLADRDAPTLDPTDDLGTAGLDRLLGSGYPILAVVHEGRVVGVLLVDDIAAWFASTSAGRRR